MITPQELSNKDFTRVLRGYSIPEVNEFFDVLKADYEELFKRNCELEKRIAVLNEKNAKLSESTITPKQVIDRANEAAEQIISNANDEAAIIIASAKTSCDNLLNEFRFHLGEERDKLVELQNAVRTFKAAIFKAYQEHIDSVVSIVDEADFESLDMEAQEYSTKVVSDIKTEVAYLVAELNQKREREAADKIADEYFENRDELLKQELKESEAPASSPVSAGSTVVFDPDIDLSDLPDTMEQTAVLRDIDELLTDTETPAAPIADEPEMTIEQIAPAASEVPEADDAPIAGEEKTEAEMSYDETLEALAMEINSESENDASDN